MGNSCLDLALEPPVIGRENELIWRVVQERDWLGLRCRPHRSFNMTVTLRPDLSVMLRVEFTSDPACLLEIPLTREFADWWAQAANATRTRLLYERAKRKGATDGDPQV